jgi:hypothetical protein
LTRFVETLPIALLLDRGFAGTSVTINARAYQNSYTASSVLAFFAAAANTIIEKNKCWSS